MAIVVPSYEELYQSILADMKDKMNISNIVGKSVLQAFARVYAAKQKVQYIMIATVNKNIYPDLCDEETLRRFGRIKLNRDIQAAIAGEYKILVSGDIGATIASSTTFSNSNGFLFVVDTTQELIATTQLIQVRALTAGIDSSLQVGDTLQVTAPLVNIDSFAIVSTIEILPASEESVEEYRKNVIDSFQLMPQGGSRADYRKWTESVPSVREVYPYVKTLATNEIDLYVEAVFSDSTDEHGTPSSTLLNAVQSAIEPDKIPMGVYQINYLPINPIAIDVVITDLSDITKISAIRSAIETLLYDKRPYIAGADLANQINKGRLYASEIFAAVVSTGVNFTLLVCEREGTPFVSTEFTVGDIPYLYTIS